MSSLTDRARKLRKAATPAEDAAWQTLRHFRELGYAVRRQHPVAGYVVDFSITSARLVIEIDGGIHNHPDVAQKDKDRDAALAESGWQVLRIPNDEVFHAEHLYARVAGALQLDD